jgi:hypothetical protein
MNHLPIATWIRDDGCQFIEFPLVCHQSFIEVPQGSFGRE